MVVGETRLMKAAKAVAEKYHSEFITPEHVAMSLLDSGEYRSAFNNLNIDTKTLKRDLEAYINESSLDPTYWDADIKITYSESLCNALQKVDELCDDENVYMDTEDQALRVILYAMAKSGSQVLENALTAQNVEIDSLMDAVHEHSEQVEKIDIRNRYLKLVDIDELDEDIRACIETHLDSIDDTAHKMGIRLVPPFATDIFIREKGRFIEDAIRMVMAHSYYHMNAYIPVEIDLADIMLSQGAKMAASDIVGSIMNTCDRLADEHGKHVVLHIYNTMSLGDSDVPLIKYILGYKDRKSVSVIMSNADEMYTKCKDAMDSAGMLMSTEELGFISEMDVLEVFRNETEYYSDLKITDEAFDLIVRVAKEITNDKAYYSHVKVILQEYVLYTKTHNEYAGINEVDVNIVKNMFKSLGKEYGQALSRVEQEIEAKNQNKGKSLNDKLKENIFGQDKAVDTVTKYIEISQAGLSEEHKPMGSFLFVGPTGVGKTELARQLADKLGYKLLKYDMSEYSESFTVSRLIGSPAGYVGYENGHTMVDDITANPKSVVLLDEIEKAHPKIYDVLLQITDDASLTDGRNGKADFSNAVIIMTSNAGAQDSTKRGIGFGNEKINSDGMKNAVNKLFKPEFRGRLSSIVEFNSLDNNIYKDIVSKELNKLKSKMAKNGGKNFIWNDNTVEFIVDHVDTKESGARQISKYVLDNVTTQISHMIVNNPDKLEYVLTCENGSLNVE